MFLFECEKVSHKVDEYQIAKNSYCKPNDYLHIHYRKIKSPWTHTAKLSHRQKKKMVYSTYIQEQVKGSDFYQIGCFWDVTLNSDVEIKWRDKH